jgi:hypothetical protein
MTIRSVVFELLSGLADRQEKAQSEVNSPSFAKFLCECAKNQIIFQRLFLANQNIRRYYRVLTMVYNTQRYWVFGLFHRPDFA